MIQTVVRYGIGMVVVATLLCACDRRESSAPPPHRISAVAEGTDDLAQWEAAGSTELHMAVGLGRIKQVRTLLAQKADVNAKDRDGRTPLHLAAMGGRADIATALLQAGAEVQPRDNQGWSPLMLAADWAKWEVYELLEQAGAREETWTALHLAAMEDDVDAARRAMADKALLNQPDRVGRTPLAWAAACAAEDVTRALIEAGADAGIADVEGLLPVHHAAQSGSAGVLRQLIAAKADPAARDADDWTPMHYAARGGHGEMVRVLLEAGAAPDDVTKDGWRPLLLLAHAHRIAHDRTLAIDAAIEALIEAGADVLARDPNGHELTSLAIAFSDPLKRRVHAIVAQRADERFERAQADFAAPQRPAFMDQPASTPQAAIRKMICALHRGEWETFRSCFQASAEEAEVVVALAAYAQRQTAFRAAMIRTYGRAGWLEFQARPTFTLVLPDVDDAAVHAARYDIDGDRASCHSLGGFDATTLTLVRRDQVWFIEMASLLDGKRPADVAKGMRAMEQALSEAQKRIGQPGVSISDIGDFLAERLFGIAPAPR